MARRLPLMSGLWKVRATAGFAVLMLIPAVAPANDEWEPTNYEKRFEAPNKGVRLKDNNVWVYKRSFAERFGMPERWVDEELDGAEAVAYRVESSSLRQCGFFGDPDNCRPVSRCLFDVYLTNEQSAMLPWKSESASDFSKGGSSVNFLSAQSRTDQKGWIEVEQRYDRSRLNIGLDSLSWVSGPPREGKVYSASSDGVRVLAYDREIFEALDYLKLVTGCNIARHENNVRIFFQDKFPDRGDFDVSYSELITGTTDNAMEFLEYKETWFRNKFSGNVRHIVSLPDNYMGRVNKYNRHNYEPKSLGSEIEKRLGSGAGPGVRNGER